MRKLNDDQLKVRDHLNGPAIVLAGPGSGKTTTLTERIYHLINSQKVKQSNILCITFTNKAASEMKARVKKKLEAERLSCFVGTFHTFCGNMLRKFGPKVGYGSNFTIIDQKDQEDFIIKVARALDIDKNDPELNLKTLIWKVNDFREKNESLDELLDSFGDDPVGQKKSQIAEQYIKSLKENNVIDFPGLQYSAVELVGNHPDVLEKIHNKFKYIMIDESQDTNNIQFKFIEYLMGKHKNVMLVGDLDQGIYSFRSANIENLLNFEKKYTDVKIYTLPKNYRSTPEIIAVADKLISHNNDRHQMKFTTDNPSGEPVAFKEVETTEKEAEIAARQILFLTQKRGVPANEIAILYRLNKLSLELQLALGKASVPFKVIGGPSFFDRKEIRDSISMLKFVSNPKDVVAFHRVAGLIKGVGDATIGNIDRIASEEGKDLLSTCKNIENYTTKKKVITAACKIRSNFGQIPIDNAGDALSKCINNTNYMKYIEEHYGDDEYVDKQENVKELINNATLYSQNTGGNIDHYLQNVVLMSSSDLESETGKVSLLTLHAAKGLEFDVVFMVGMEQDILPHRRAVVEANDPEKARQEERRLAYVGFTRARKNLYLLRAKERKQRDRSGAMRYQKTLPSQFLKDAGFKSTDQG